MSEYEPLTGAELAAVKARAAEVETGPRAAADREELLRLLAVDVNGLVAEVERLRARLGAIKGKAKPIIEFADYPEDDEHEVWVIVAGNRTRTLTLGNIRALAAELEKP